MMDWQNVNLKECVFDVEVEGIREIGPSQVFPVKVFTKDGVPVMVCNIPVRTEFYRQLKQTVDWQSVLLKILKTRVRDEVLKRKKQNPISIEDKLGFMGKQISVTD